MRRLLALGLGLGLIIGLTSAGGWAWLERWRELPGPHAARAVVELERGAGVRGIARRLAEAGVIDNALAFELAARLRGEARSLKAGEFAFEPGASPASIVAALASGRVLLHPVTIPEGRTVAEIADLLAAEPALAGELGLLPPEGALLPDTYLVPRGELRTRLIQRMQGAMARALDEAWVARAPGLPLNGPGELVTLASIVERETALPGEHRLVAAVLVNRLRLGMKLQTDPTVIYALAGGRGSLGRTLTRADLEVDHPFNTYRALGLPPGPIANPGRAALQAAATPASVDYLYFVADGQGGHVFARSLAEHNRNVARWRQLRDGAPKRAP